MLIANTKDGQSISIDTTDPDAISILQDLVDSDQITALSFLHEGVRHVLPLHKRFRRILYGGEPLYNGTKDPIGWAIFVQADDVRVTLTWLAASKLIRCDLVKTGHLQYNPRGRRPS